MGKKGKLQKFAEVSEFSNCYERASKLRGKWATHVFKNSNPITLELACGKGEYTTGLAEKFPNRNFIGVDHFETYHEDGEYYCSHSENYIDGSELNEILEEELKCDVSDDNFDWWEEYKDTGLVPSECVDEMVYDFFETGELKWVS